MVRQVMYNRKKNPLQVIPETLIRPPKPGFIKRHDKNFIKIFAIFNKLAILEQNFGVSTIEKLKLKPSNDSSYYIEDQFCKNFANETDLRKRRHHSVNLTGWLSALAWISWAFSMSNKCYPSTKWRFKDRHAYINVSIQWILFLNAEKCRHRYREKTTNFKLHQLTINLL